MFYNRRDDHGIKEHLKIHSRVTILSFTQSFKIIAMIDNYYLFIIIMEPKVFETLRKSFRMMEMIVVRTSRESYLFALNYL